jgi:ABC-type amino acid transport substrate-binding protein
VIEQLSRDGREAVPAWFTMNLRDMNLRWIGLLAAALFGLRAHAGAETPTVTAGATLRQIQAAGELHCGVVVAREDWNKVDLHGDLSSLDAEICKAVGIAALGTHAQDRHHHIQFRGSRPNRDSVIRVLSSWSV